MHKNFEVLDLPHLLLAFVYRVTLGVDVGIANGKTRRAGVHFIKSLSRLGIM